MLFKYDQDPEKTELIIRSKNAFDAEKLGRYPMIVLERQMVRPKKSSMKMREAYDQKTATTTYLDVWNIPFVLHCLSTNDVEAETLGFVTGTAVWMHRDQINYPGKHFVEFDAIGAPRILEIENKPVFDVPVRISCWIHMGFRVGPKDAETFSGTDGSVLIEQKLDD